MRKRHKDLVGDDDVIVRKVIYFDENGDYVEMRESTRKYMYQQFDKNRGIKYVPKNKKGGRHVK